MHNLTKDQAFFYTHAGYSWNTSAGETQEQGRVRCAIQLADAETLYLQAHRVADVVIEWEHDEQAHYDARRSGGGDDYDTIEQATLWLGPDNRECLASLGGITDADANYRRVVRAQLADECADRLREIIGANT